MALRSCFRCSRRRLRASRCGSLMLEFVALGCSVLVHVDFLDVSFEGQLFGGSSSGLFFPPLFLVFPRAAASRSRSRVGTFVFFFNWRLAAQFFSSRAVLRNPWQSDSASAGRLKREMALLSLQSAQSVHTWGATGCTRTHAGRHAHTHTCTLPHVARARVHSVCTARAPRSTHVRACPQARCARRNLSVSGWTVQMAGSGAACIAGCAVSVLLTKKCARARAHNSALCGLTVKHHSRSHKCSSSSCRNVTTHRVEPTRT